MMLDDKYQYHKCADASVLDMAKNRDSISCTYHANPCNHVLQVSLAKSLLLYMVDSPIHNLTGLKAG